MKIELEYDPAQYRLRSISPPDPDYVDANHRLRQWRVWIYVHPDRGGYSWFGDGDTPQEAYVDAVAKLEERLPLLAQGGYNKRVRTKPSLDLSLDLSDL